MSTKTILVILHLLILPFFGLQAQETAAENETHEAVLKFESVCFSTECGNVIITCDNAGQLSEFEINGQDAHRLFEWDGLQASERFSMKMGFKPGIVMIKYKMRGGQSKVIELKVLPHDDVKLTL